jgi:hypothetical protein
MFDVDTSLSILTVLFALFGIWFLIVYIVHWGYGPGPPIPLVSGKQHCSPSRTKSQPRLKLSQLANFQQSD